LKYYYYFEVNNSHIVTHSSNRIWEIIAIIILILYCINIIRKSGLSWITGKVKRMYEPQNLVIHKCFCVVTRSLFVNFDFTLRFHHFLYHILIKPSFCNILLLCWYIIVPHGFHFMLPFSLLLSWSYGASSYFIPSLFPCLTYWTVGFPILKWWLNGGIYVNTMPKRIFNLKHTRASRLQIYQNIKSMLP